MLSRQEKRDWHREFWTTFGVFMRKHQSMTGTKVKWLNYRTGVKDIYFRMEADGKKARFCIDIQHSDEGIRELYFEQFKEVKTVLEATIGEELIWDEAYYFEETRRTACRIYAEKDKINIFDKSQWSELFAFFEKYIVGIDEFWADFNELFKALD